MEEHTADSPSFFQNLTMGKKIALIGGGIFLYVVYIILNIRIYQFARAQKSNQTGAPIVTNQAGSAGSAPTAPEAGKPIKPTAVPTQQLTGPGPYACSPIGTCKEYADDIRREKCTVTYADEFCLKQCADVAKQCKN